MGLLSTVTAGGAVAAASVSRQLPAARWADMVSASTCTKLRKMRGSYKDLCDAYAPIKQNAAVCHEGWCVARLIEWPCCIDATYGAGAFATWLAGQLLYHYQVLHHDESYAQCEEIATTMACALPQRPIGCYQCFLAQIRAGRWGNDYGRQDVTQICTWWREYNVLLYEQYKRTHLMLRRWNDADDSKIGA